MTWTGITLGHVAVPIEARLEDALVSPSGDASLPRGEHVASGDALSKECKNLLDECLGCCITSPIEMALESDATGLWWL